MTDQGEPFVEVLRVLALQALHAGRERWLGCLDQEVEVVRHEAVGGNAPPIPADHAIAQREKLDTIVVVLEDRLAAVPARRDVIEASGDLDAGCSRHSGRVWPVSNTRPLRDYPGAKLARPGDMAGV